MTMCLNSISEVSTHYLVFIIIAVILTAVILAIFLEEVFFMFSNAKMRDWKLKDKALVLLGIYPVSIKQCPVHKSRKNLKL